MAEDKVYSPEVIDDNALPQQYEWPDYSTSQDTTSETVSQITIKDQTTPSKRVAVELIGSSLNTKSKRILAEFQFTESGAIQIGKYENGVSGDIRISPNGIVGRNSSGILTFSLDATTGDAVFAGTIQAGTLIGGKVAVGDGDILIDGEEKRMVFYDPETELPSIIIGNA